MNKEVSFSIAKLLKEKGFDENCKFGYSGWFEPHHIGLIEFGYLQKNSELLKLTYTAPTIADVVMWLYEKYKIWISVNIDDGIIETNFPLNSCGTFDTPTKAYEAAIEYALKHII